MFAATAANHEDFHGHQHGTAPTGLGVFVPPITDAGKKIGTRNARAPCPSSAKQPCEPLPYFAVTVTLTGDELVASCVESPRYFAVTA